MNPAIKKVSYGRGNQIMASWFVGIGAVGLLARGLDRRRAAHSSLKEENSRTRRRAASEFSEPREFVTTERHQIRPTLPDLEHVKCGGVEQPQLSRCKAGFVVTPSMSSRTGIARNHAWSSIESWSCVIALVSNPVNSPQHHQSSSWRIPHGNWAPCVIAGDGH